MLPRWPVGTARRRRALPVGEPQKAAKPKQAATWVGRLLAGGPSPPWSLCAINQIRRGVATVKPATPESRSTTGTVCRTSGHDPSGATLLPR